MTSDEGRLIEVRLLGYPLELHRRSQQHHDRMLREFQLLDTTSDEIPSRLIELVKEFSAVYAESIGPAERLRDEAIARGDQTIDLVYDAPRTGASDALRLARLWDDADDYSRANPQLVELATPPDLVALRRWYFGEFIRQLTGEPPMRWSDFRPAPREEQ
jgi:hypothetical protein